MSSLAVIDLKSSESGLKTKKALGCAITSQQPYI